MKNSLGHPARGEAFYPRNAEVKRIYRVLNSKTSIYLSAPRRVGKTSILKHIEENPAKGFYFIYIITESIEKENEFYKAIFERLVESDAINSMIKIFEGLKDVVFGVLNRVRKVYNVEIREADETDYYQVLLELFSHIKVEYGQVVIMIDEFPQTIQNILNVSGAIVAERFIQKNRQLRHNHHVVDKIAFIYTGSQSLYPMVEKVTSLTAVNDLKTVEVQPLNEVEGKDLLKQLLDYDNVIISNDVIEYTIKKIGWLIPFHIQLIEQEILDVFESTNIPIENSHVDVAFEQIVHSRNKPQFEPYFARLKTLFKAEEYQFGLELLKYIAINETIEHDVILDISVKYTTNNYEEVLEILKGDGYIYITNGAYRYVSPILKCWCQKHICN